MSKFSRGHLRSAKLNASQVLRIRELYADGEAPDFIPWSQGRLSREFGISIGQIGRIVRNEVWQDYQHVATQEEIEHRRATEPPADPSEIESSQRLLEALIASDPQGRRHEDDPLDEILKRRGGEDPLAIKKDD